VVQAVQAAVNSQRHGVTASGAGGGGVTAEVPVVTSRLEVRDILHKLNGMEHVDAIC
jgi:hypothetical protein